MAVRRLSTAVGLIGLAATAAVATAVLIDLMPASATMASTAVHRASPVRPVPVLGKPASGSPDSLWVDPTNPAAKARITFSGQGRTANANELAKISSRPTATWLTGDADSAVSTVKRVVSASAAVGQLPVFVLYHLPNRDCGGYSAGGAAGAKAYQSGSVQSRVRSETRGPR